MPLSPSPDKPLLLRLSLKIQQSRRKTDGFGLFNAMDESTDTANSNQSLQLAQTPLLQRRKVRVKRLVNVLLNGFGANVLKLALLPALHFRQPGNR